MTEQIVSYCKNTYYKIKRNIPFLTWFGSILIGECIGMNLALDDIKNHPDKFSSVISKISYGSTSIFIGMYWGFIFGNNILNNTTTTIFSSMIGVTWYFGNMRSKL